LSKKKPKNSFSVEEIFKLEEAAANGDKEAEEKLASIDGYEKSSPKQMGAQNLSGNCKVMLRRSCLHQMPRLTYGLITCMQSGRQVEKLP